MTRAIRSLRILRKHWKLTAIAVFSLSIAMALGVVSLSISNTFLMLAPPVPGADRLVMIYSRSPSEPVDQISYPDYQYLRENNNVFSDIAAAPNSISVSEDSHFENRTVKVISRPVSGNYLSVMGIRPHLGRLLTLEDDRSKEKVAVMTYSCWRRLGGDPKIIGKVLAGNTIVGVLPKEFTGTLYGIDGDLLLAFGESSFPPAWRTQRDARHLMLTARLKPGVSRAQAKTEIAALSRQLASAYPKEDKDRLAIVTRATLLPPDGIATAELMIGVLITVVLLVLLIASANVANLLLAVAVGRRQEAVIKLALGASRRRLIREFLKESTVICVFSAALGYFAAAFLISRYSEVNVAFPMVGTVSFGLNLHLDATVVAFTVVLMLIAIFATGLAPALYASAPSLSQVLSGESVVGGTGKNVRRNLLVIVQVAVSTLVLVGMGLCQRSLYILRHTDPGFSARNLVAMSVYPLESGYSETKGKELFASMRERVLVLPGIESVTLASHLPLLGKNEEPVKFPDGTKDVQTGRAIVDPDYFETLRIRVLSGRVFNSFDRENSPAVAIVNHKMAEMFWPGQDAVGKTVLVGEKPVKEIVVGVVADGKYEGLDEEATPFMYAALAQHYQGGINIIARTKTDPQLSIVPMTQVARELNLFALNPVAFDSWLNLSLVVERFTAACVATLAGLGLLLAIIGLFGAISYSVSERRKELGIRVALGARPGQLLHMILRQTLVIAGTGVTLGLVLGVGVTMMLRSQFYKISAVEWTVLVPVCAAMLAISLLVAFLSARPWINIDPMEAVRHA